MRSIRIRNLVLVIVCAAVTFGGTFTCRANNDSDDFTRSPGTGAGK